MAAPSPQARKTARERRERLHAERAARDHRIETAAAATIDALMTHQNAKHDLATAAIGVGVALQALMKKGVRGEELTKLTGLTTAQIRSFQAASRSQGVSTPAAAATPSTDSPAESATPSSTDGPRGSATPPAA